MGGRRHPTDITLVIHRGTVEDTELIDGLVLDLKASHVAGGVTRVEKAKIGLIQFCISPPKTDVSYSGLRACVRVCVCVVLVCVCVYTFMFMCTCVCIHLCTC